ncbi:ABC transporter substrate-binding protein [Dictyobacter kobayashii]|uniref:Peptide ABC transporter substrate-binding protein n=1 Tax=Dictyobacter kobayashii TaxID=2014872 RepID=A0A402AU44_9CHLR|nr:ABC transporter substrate-binding protein [Dictyobacter kobayashii]GCE22666.1 peptide ABC transporter substrate-binding protein [Dictyobacter kobayashii]
MSSESGMTRKRLGATLLTLFIVLGVLLTACGGANNGSNASGGKNDRILTLQNGPNGDFSKALSPYTTAGVNPGAQGLVYETLLYFDQAKGGEITPWLADSYEFSKDAKSITYHLRNNVKWSDGQPFTANDVVFTFNMLKKYPAADTNSLWKSIKDVVAADDHTVNITLNQSNSTMLWYTGGQIWIVPQHAWQNVGDPTKYVNDTPVGTGPFTLKNFTPQLIDYVRNPNYWQADKVEVQEVRYPSYNTNTSVELDLNRGNLDWTGIFLPKVQDSYVGRDKEHNHYWFAPLSPVMLYLNTAKSPFDQLNVRQAISLALDRDQMYKVAESGHEPVAHPSGLVTPAYDNLVAPEYKDAAFKQDIAKAQQLMESAGFKKGADGIYVGTDGKKLSFKIGVVTGWSDWVTICQIAASNLKQIGIDAQVDPQAYTAYYTSLQTGSFDMAVSWTNAGPSPYYMFNGLLNSKNTAAVGKVAASNWSRWQDPQTDSLLNQYATSTDKTVQQTALNGLEKIMVEKLPALPLVYGVNFAEYSSAKFTGWPTPDDPYALAAPYSVPDVGVVVTHLKAVK